jgi:hypothetical protein
LYCFNEKQLYDLLREAIDLYQENIDQHGQRQTLARLEAITGMVEGLDAETELLSQGEKLTPTFTLMEAVNV